MVTNKHEGENRSHTQNNYTEINSDIPADKSKHYLQLQRGIQQLIEGDQRFGPIDTIVYNKINLLAELGLLEDDKWHLDNLKDGLILHHDFLDMQNEFSALEGNNDSNFWNADLCIEIMKEYLIVSHKQRIQHMTLWKFALSALKDCGEEKLAEMLMSNWANDMGVDTHQEAIDLYLSKRILIGIPWVDDGLFLWRNTLKIPKSLTDRYSSVKKINEIGLIFSSRLFRGISVPSHDYFSYANNEASRRNITIDKMFLLTAKHEGSHGPIESQSCLMAGFPEQSFIMEGFPSVLGDDKREMTPIEGLDTPVNIGLLVNQEEIEDEGLKKQVIYIGGARFYRAILNLIEVDDINKKWQIVSVAMLQSANEISGIDGNYSLKMRKFVIKFLEILKITEVELNQELTKFT